jgi:hypothetical protein
MVTNWSAIAEKNTSNPENITLNFTNEHVTRALHARLVCGVKFFDSNKKMTEEVALCIVKMACVQLAKLSAKGAISEEITKAEMEFAANGDISRGRRSSTHPLCKKCDQDLCPIWKTVNGKALMA